MSGNSGSGMHVYTDMTACRRFIDKLERAFSEEMYNITIYTNRKISLFACGVLMFWKYNILHIPYHGLCLYLLLLKHCLFFECFDDRHYVMDKQS